MAPISSSSRIGCASTVKRVAKNEPRSVHVEVQKKEVEWQEYGTVPLLQDLLVVLFRASPRGLILRSMRRSIVSNLVRKTSVAVMLPMISVSCASKLFSDVLLIKRAKSPAEHTQKKSLADWSLK